MHQIELNFDHASVNADNGMSVAALNADSKSARWTEDALSWVSVFVAYTQGRGFMAEEVRQYAHDRGLPQPPSARAWGAVMIRAAKNGIIRAVGYGLTRNPQAHKTPARVWAAA